MCAAQGVKMDCPLRLDLEMLQSFAAEFGVTLQVEEHQINVLGIEGAVMEAAKELEYFDNNRQSVKLGANGQPSNAARLAILEAIAILNLDRDVASDSGAEHSGIMDGTMQGAVMSIPPLYKPPQKQQQYHN